MPGDNLCRNIAARLPCAKGTALESAIGYRRLRRKRMDACGFSRTDMNGFGLMRDSSGRSRRQRRRRLKSARR